MKATSILSCIFLILNYSCLVCLAQLDDITKATSALTSWEQISKVTADVRDQIGTALEPLQGEFHKMSPKGRYATGVVVGYTSTKFAFKTTVKIAKVSGAAFIVSEVANRAGVLSNISEENAESLQTVRQKVTETVNCCRLQVRKHLSIGNIRSIFDRTMEKDTMGTLGFTTGAVAGLVF